MPAPKKRSISQKSEMIYDAHTFGVILDTREIFLGPDPSYHYDDAMIDFKAATTFITNMRLLNSIGDDPIIVHMNTCGGDWNNGMAIYDVIKDSPSEVTIVAYSYARSMSSIIPQAATWRVIMPNADFLIHHGTLDMGGNYQSVVSDVDQAKIDTEIMLDIYVDRCLEGQFFQKKKMGKNAIRDWLQNQMARKQEFYMSPRESVEYGLMDGVLGDEDFESISALIG